MRICFVSFEYPPDTGIGGIATYVQQIARALAQKGVDVEVVCASSKRADEIRESDHLYITKIKCRNTEQFRRLSPAAVLGRHHLKPFDLVEVPEYGAEGLYFKETLPGVPLIVKLHTPRFLIKEINDHYYDKKAWRLVKKMLLRKYNKEKDPEYQAVQNADRILSPSRSLASIVTDRWNIPASKITHAPNPYYPSMRILSISPDPHSQTIIYLGRLETRKGVYNFARAIPCIAKRHPAVRFIFLGRDSRGPNREKSMKAVMLKVIGEYARQVEFIDHVPLEEVPIYLERAAIAVFPSLWENFPNVCLEAMSAGLGIIASNQGGMKDMLEDIDPGCLADPHNVEALCEKTSALLSDRARRIENGKKSRSKAAGYYGDVLINELIDIYQSFLQPEMHSKQKSHA